MYNTSDAYKTKIRESSRHYEWYGDIVDSSGNKYPFKNRHIVKGSGKIIRSCSGSSALKIGTVYASELNISLFLDVDRYKLYDGTISPYFRLWLDDDTYEDIPLGVFTISECTRKVKIIQIKAYDNMVKFDKSFPADTSGGMPYDWLLAACTACHVTFGMTEAQVQALPNGTQTFYLPEDNDIDSWRDMLSYMAAATCSMCQINRAGELILIQYGMVSNATIPQKWRFDSTFSDFETQYTAVSATYTAGKVSEYYALEADTGLTYNLGTNPFLQFGADAVRKAVITNILDALGTAIYTPFETTCPGDPSLDPGDVLDFSGGQAVTGKLACITEIDLAINGKTDLKCVGENPRLAGAKSKNEKNISGLISEVEKDNSTFYIYSFKNVEALNITTEEKTVATIDYATVDDTRINFIFTCQHNVTLDGNVLVKIYLDGELFQTYTNYEARGDNVLTIDFTADVRANARYELKVTMQWGLFISDRRIDRADRLTLWNYADAIVWAMARSAGTWSAIQIFTWDHVSNYTWDDLSQTEISQNTWDDVLNGSNAINPADISYTKVDPDETTGEINIGIEGITGVVFGRGLAATDVWDGTIKCEDYVGKVTIAPEFALSGTLTDEAEAGTLVPLESGVSDVIKLLSINPVFALNNPLKDLFAVSEYVGNDIIINGSNTGTEDVDIPRDISGVSIDADDDALFAASNDAGITWFNWLNAKWTKVEEGEGQSGTALVAAPADSWNALCVTDLRFRWSGVCRTITITMVEE